METPTAIDQSSRNGQATLQVICGDALTELRQLPAESVQCCVSSPPYWGLRDYSTNGQLGLEETPAEYVANMVEVFREVRRVLRKDGTLWLNLGDSYAGSWGNYHPDSPPGKHGQRLKETARWNRPAYSSQDFLPPTANIKGLKPKDLCGIPWRVAFALQADGWWLRSDIIWAKPNPMPESVLDRPTKSHEYIFLLTKSANYFYDAEAIKEQAVYDGRNDEMMKGSAKYENGFTPIDSHQTMAVRGQLRWQKNDDGLRIRNKRSVWSVATAPYPEAHFATYPPDLIKPCILAGTSAKGCCAKCGAPWERVVESSNEARTLNKGRNGFRLDEIKAETNKGASSAGYSETKTVGWQPTCKHEDGWIARLCDHYAVQSCTVLDPFAGSGTTGMVALELGRRAILIELNPKYIDLIRQRCNVTPGLALA